jgi:RNA polymerase sigma-70 factor (ECF subfamily)
MPATDNQRFKTLIEPQLDALFGAAYRLSRNRADAEDLVQDTCIRACLRLDELRETEPVRAWLLRVLHNLFVDGTRRTQRSPVTASATVDALAAALACPDPTPEESACNGQREAALERAWLSLDRDQRALLGLRAEGYTLAEISSITRIAMDALTMRLYRARKNLTRCLKDQQALPTESRREAVQ